MAAKKKDEGIVWGVLGRGNVRLYPVNPKMWGYMELDIKRQPGQCWGEMKKPEKTGWAAGRVRSLHVKIRGATPMMIGH